MLLAAEAGVPTELLRTSRGWTEDEWAAATDRLRERGLVDRDSGTTDAGRDLRALVETRHRRRGPRALRGGAARCRRRADARPRAARARRGRERAHPVPEPHRPARPGGLTSSAVTAFGVVQHDGQPRQLQRPVASTRQHGAGRCRAVAPECRRRAPRAPAPPGPATVRLQVHQASNDGDRSGTATWSRVRAGEPSAGEQLPEAVGVGQRERARDSRWGHVDAGDLGDGVEQHAQPRVILPRGPHRHRGAPGRAQDTVHLGRGASRSRANIIPSRHSTTS